MKCYNCENEVNSRRVTILEDMITERKGDIANLEKQIENLRKEIIGTKNAQVNGYCSIHCEAQGKKSSAT